jgi:anaerobic magnesium-protoporphyrin IX monomethyl ester cyclase
MNVLLLSMPDSFEHMPPVAIRMPNGALASLAGNIDAHHRVAIADLILAQSSVRATVERLVCERAPDLVGLSVMTFQRATALAIAKLVRAIRPSTRIVVGGYDPSLAPHEYESSSDVDFIVRGEGEHTLRELLRALELERDLESSTPNRECPRLGAIAGLSYRTGDSPRGRDAGPAQT